MTKPKIFHQFRTLSALPWSLLFWWGVRREHEWTHLLQDHPGRRRQWLCHDRKLGPCLSISLRFFANGRNQGIVGRPSLKFRGGVCCFSILDSVNKHSSRCSEEPKQKVRIWKLLPGRRRHITLRHKFVSPNVWRRPPLCTSNRNLRRTGLLQWRCNRYKTFIALCLVILICPQTS